MHLTSKQYVTVLCAVDVYLKASKLAPQSSAMVAKRLGISNEYASQCLRLLVAGGLLSTKHGSFGGYFYENDPSQVTVKEISSLVHCKDRVWMCGEQRSIANGIEKMFNNVTIETLSELVYKQMEFEHEEQQYKRISHTT